MHRLHGFQGGAGQCQDHLCFAQSHPARAVKQSEMALACAEVRDSQGKPRCESRLAAASAGPGATQQEVPELVAH